MASQQNLREPGSLTGTQALAALAGAVAGLIVYGFVLAGFVALLREGIALGIIAIGGFIFAVLGGAIGGAKLAGHKDKVLGPGRVSGNVRASFKAIVSAILIVLVIGAAYLGVFSIYAWTKNASLRDIATKQYCSRLGCSKLATHSKKYVYVSRVSGQEYNPHAVWYCDEHLP